MQANSSHLQPLGYELQAEGLQSSKRSSPTRNPGTRAMENAIRASRVSRSQEFERLSNELLVVLKDANSHSAAFETAVSRRLLRQCDIDFFSG
jgi:hypothetical protein